MEAATRDIPIGGSEHAVHFYEDDLDLAQTVGGYLADALNAGSIAIAIATEPHRRAFQDVLESAGFDCEQARREGTLLLLDAAAAMARFMPGGRIDGAAFHRVIGGLFEQAAGSDRPICAYGEMVALLWDAGDVLGAIELEKLWNELGRRLPLSLLCAYRHESTMGSEHADALRQVCALHSSVLHRPAGTCEPASTTARFSADSYAPRAARHFVADALQAWGEVALLDDAELVVSELATNAVIHARTPFSVALRRGNFGVRISVRDSSSARLSVRDPGPSVPSGRGLILVADLAARWGSDVTPVGKTVWAELRA